MTPEIIAGIVGAISTLITTLITHIDKDPETLRLLKIQDVNQTLVNLSEDLDNLITAIHNEGIDK